MSTAKKPPVKKTGTTPPKEKVKGIKRDPMQKPKLRKLEE
jgi:hypothetical protein